jgi:hypothetical protein
MTSKNEKNKVKSILEGRKKKSNKRFERGILVEADHIVNTDRPDRYGDVGESFDRAAKIATLMMTPKQLEGGEITPQMVCIIVRALKATRDVYSPENPDHMRDQCGYAELQDQLRQLGYE